MQEQNLFVNSEPVEDIALRDCDHCYEDYDISVWNGPCAWVPTCPENDCGCAWPPARTCPPCAYEAPYEPFDPEVPCVPPAPCPCEPCEPCEPCTECQEPEPPMPCEEETVPYCAVCDAEGAENITFDVSEIPSPVVPGKPCDTTLKADPAPEMAEPTEQEEPQTAQEPDAALQADDDTVLSAVSDTEMPTLFAPLHPQETGVIQSRADDEETMFFPAPAQDDTQEAQPDVDAEQQNQLADVERVNEQTQSAEEPFAGDLLPYESEIVQL